jgi:predicted dehydrogenase
MRFGLLGTGYWAETTHGAALAAHPRAQLGGVWGRDPAKTRALAERLGTIPYEDVDALLADVDAVAVALPPDVQAPLAARAAAAGKHLLLDKPLALTVPGAEAVVAAAERSGVASVVFFTGRFDPVVIEALAEAERVGGWTAARVTMLVSIYRSGSPYAQSAWRRQHGGLWDIGPHALSRLLPMLGPVRQVTAFAGARDTTHVLLRHVTGVVSEMALTLNAPADVSVFEVVLYGESGVVELPSGSIGAVEAFGDAIDQLIAQAGTADPRHACDVVFAAQVVRVLAAAEASARTGQCVEVIY